MCQMSHFIIGTCGHIDHGKTALIQALNGFDGDSTKEEKSRGITIDLSFSNLVQDDKNIAFIDVPGHEKLIKNMISGAFGFDCVMIIVSASEKIKPQTVEHLEILKLLGVKDAVLVITKKDLLDAEELEKNTKEIKAFVESYAFNLHFVQAVSIYDEHSIQTLKRELFTLKTASKQEENFFRAYVDRSFSLKGVGTVVTATVLGKSISKRQKLFICDLNRECKIKNLQVHDEDVEQAEISNRVAINLANIDAKQIKKGALLSTKGRLRGFNEIDISFFTLKDKKLKHNQTYFLYIGAKRIEAKVILFDTEIAQERGFARLKLKENIFSIYGEKLIIRSATSTLAGGRVLSSISDPINKKQRLHLLLALEKSDFTLAYEILLQAHKKGLGLISSAQRFALSHEEALTQAHKLKNCFVDEKALIVYPLSTLQEVRDFVVNIYEKNAYALLSLHALGLRLPWASEGFITLAIEELLDEGLLIQEGNLYKNANITEDMTKVLQDLLIKRLIEEDISPTAPYNIYDDLDLDRKTGDDLLKGLCAKKELVRVTHNISIHAQSLSKLIANLKQIMQNEGYLDLGNFKTHYPLSRKYLIAYLDYLDNFNDIKNDNGKRVFNSDSH